VKFSYIGYETVNFTSIIKSSEPETLDIRMISKPYLAEQAIITASRIEVARNMTPMSVSLVNRRTLDESGESNLLPVVSRQVPGMFVTERGITGFGVADGAAGQIRIRGIGGSPNTQVLVMIDGHPQFMGLFGHPLPDAYVASDAEKVEVIRGPASTLYGSNAMAGVINIITRKQDKDGLTILANGGYGSFNTYKINGSVGYRHKKLQLYASINRDATDGHRDYSEFRLTNGYFKTSHDINSNLKILADVGYAFYSSTNPGPEGTTDSTYFTALGHWQDIGRGMASATFENRFDKAQGAVKFYYNWGVHDLWDGFHSNDANFGLMFHEVLKLFPANTITIGLDYADYGGDAINDRPEVPVQFVDTSVFETGGYILAQQVLLKKLTVSAGIRLQYNEIFGSEWLPQAGISYNITENSTARVNISKGYRSPTIRELFMFQPANPDLQPENMWNYEAGFLQKFLNQKLSLDITVFYDKGENLIQVEGVFPDVEYRNTGRFEHYGIEFQGRYLILDNLDVMANYSWLHTDKTILAAPKNMVYTEANYNLKGFRFRLSGQYIGQLPLTIDPYSEESFFLLSARVSYCYKDFVTLYIDGNNLLDEDYSINNGYPMPGINFFGGIMLKLDLLKKENRKN
jgi:iron complex outermembrane receptor protein